MFEKSCARSALLSRRCALLAPALGAAAHPRAARALSLPPPDPWAFSPAIKEIQVGASVLVRTTQGWRVLRSGQQPISGATPHLEPAGLLRPELGDDLDRRCAEVAAATLRRHPQGRRGHGVGGRPGEPSPPPRVIFPESRAAHTEADERRRLYIWVTLLVQDITDELPERPRRGVRFLALLDRAYQSRRFADGQRERTLYSRVTHHTVKPDTIEEQVLRRFDDVVERAVLFDGPGYDGPSAL